MYFVEKQPNKNTTSSKTKNNIPIKYLKLFNLPYALNFQAIDLVQVLSLMYHAQIKLLCLQPLPVIYNVRKQNNEV